MRISLQVSGLEHDVHDRTAIGAGEPPAVIVEGEAELPLPACHLERERQRVEARIVGAERNGGSFGAIGAVTWPPANPLVK